MKNILSQVLMNNLIARTALGRQRRPNNLYRRKMWAPRMRGNTVGRRPRRFNKGMKLEVDHAEGGYKQVYNNGRVAQQTIELYTDIGVYNSNYAFTQETEPLQYNLQRALNDNTEFLNLRRTSLQYKIRMISFSFNYNRVPQAREKFAKMLLTPETDMVLQATDPKINNNTMVWGMTANGSKNYNFRINNRNTEKINQEWQISDSQWNAICILHLSSQGYIKIIPEQDPPENETLLGEMKISVSVLYVKSDSENNNRVHLTAMNILNKIAEDNRAKYESKAIVEKKQQNNRKIKELEEANTKLEEQYKEKEEDLTRISEFKLE